MSTEQNLSVEETVALLQTQLQDYARLPDDLVQDQMSNKYTKTVLNNLLDCIVEQYPTAKLMFKTNSKKDIISNIILVGLQPLREAVPINPTTVSNERRALEDDDDDNEENEASTAPLESVEMNQVVEMKEAVEDVQDAAVAISIDLAVIAQELLNNVENAINYQYLDVHPFIEAMKYIVSSIEQAEVKQTVSRISPQAFVNMYVQSWGTMHSNDGLLETIKIIGKHLSNKRFTTTESKLQYIKQFISFLSLPEQNTDELQDEVKYQDEVEHAQPSLGITASQYITPELVDKWEQEQDEQQDTIVAEYSNENYLHDRIYHHLISHGITGIQSTQSVYDMVQVCVGIIEEQKCTFDKNYQQHVQQSAQLHKQYVDQAMLEMKEQHDDFMQQIHTLQANHKQQIEDISVEFDTMYQLHDNIKKELEQSKQLVAQTQQENLTIQEELQCLQKDFEVIKQDYTAINNKYVQERKSNLSTQQQLEDALNFISQLQADLQQYKESETSQNTSPPVVPVAPISNKPLSTTSISTSSTTTTTPSTTISSSSIITTPSTTNQDDHNQLIQRIKRTEINIDMTKSTDSIQNLVNKMKRTISTIVYEDQSVAKRVNIAEHSNLSTKEALNASMKQILYNK